MTEHIVREWLSDYAALSPEEVHSFATSLEHNQELVSALYSVLENREYYQKLIDPVCNQLFAFYRSREVELQRFTLQFLPTLIYVYLNSVASGKKKSCWSVETLLIGLYNLEVVDENGQPRVISFRLPSLAQASVYHEPLDLDPASLTQKELRRLEECNSRLIAWGPLPQVESLNAQNRLKVMTALWFIFNRHLSHLHKSALERLCRICSKLVAQGFPRAGGTGATNKLPPRIPVSTQFLLELLHAIYFAMFNEFSSMAVQALEDIQFRGYFECYAEVILVSGAVRNSIKDTPTGQTLEGPMGISMAVSPATNTVTVSKSMITNASFRTKKLPDDIEEELVAHLAEEVKGSPVERKRRGWSWRSGQGSAACKSDAGRQGHGGRQPPSRRESSSKTTASPASGSPASGSPASGSPASTADPLIKRVPSPKKRDTDDQHSAAQSRVLNRMSAGARLFRVIEENGTGTPDEHYFVAGRPASLGPLPSTQVDVSNA